MYVLGSKLYVYNKLPESTQNTINKQYDKTKKLVMPKKAVSAYLNINSG